MPFDFHTHRKAKAFFNEPIQDIDVLIKNQALSRKDNPEELALLKIQADKLQFDEDEDAKLKEVPELNARLKLMYQLKPQPKLI